MYSEGLKQPLSCFAVLHEWEAVLQKGVKEIHHCMCDGYYKCVLLVIAKDIMHILADTMGQDPHMA